MSVDTHRLAVVIPAFKSAYLYETLESLANQNCQEFAVYIGDDASPEDLYSIVEEFQSHLKIHYIRYSTNLGRGCLVGQWKRCVELTSEPYIWLFCDDDKMDRDCISSFYNCLDSNRKSFDLYRFNNAMIDENGRVIAYGGQAPRVESHMEFLMSRLRFQRMSFISEYVFSRQAYEREGGFVSFPLAWHSDDASWTVFSRLTGIYTVPGPMVYWRLSRENICGSTDTPCGQKLEATLLFLEWVYELYHSGAQDNRVMDPPSFKKLLENWFVIQLRHNRIGHLNAFMILKIMMRTMPFFHGNRFGVLCKLAAFNRNWVKLNRRVSRLATAKSHRSSRAT